MVRLRLRTRRDVRAFSVALTAIVMLGNLIMQDLFMPSDLAEQIRFSGSIIALSLAAPLSYFVGLRLHDIHRLYVDLEHAARSDPLTGLLTRRAFMDRVQSLDLRDGVVIMVDIDHFKCFNDTHGHAVGDAALRRVAHSLLSGCRAEDMVARFGGEEFIIFLVDTDMENGSHVAERLRRQLQEKPICHDGRLLPVTASFGVAALTGTMGLEKAMSNADCALYEAKARGRNQVRVFT
ncbi:MAG: GGDEF domain-containing protein [Pseudomonadota bacterium]